MRDQRVYRLFQGQKRTKVSNNLLIITAHKIIACFNRVALFNATILILSNSTFFSLFPCHLDSSNNYTAIVSRPMMMTATVAKRNSIFKWNRIKPARSSSVFYFVSDSSSQPSFLLKKFVYKYKYFCDPIVPEQISDYGGHRISFPRLSLQPMPPP